MAVTSGRQQAGLQDAITESPLRPQFGLHRREEVEISYGTGTLVIWASARTAPAGAGDVG